MSFRINGLHLLIVHMKNLCIKRVQSLNNIQLVSILKKILQTQNLAQNQSHHFICELNVIVFYDNVPIPHFIQNLFELIDFVQLLDMVEKLRSVQSYLYDS